MGQGSDTRPDVDADRRPLPGSFYGPAPLLACALRLPQHLSGQGDGVQPCRTARPVLQEEPSRRRQGPVGRGSGGRF